ncbi:MAG: aspartate racemase [Thermotogaceae bacterium]|jgi:aspartate racemase|nr:aspartate racemase [Thermotogaceae bacterium]MDN5337380.1 aspartate racemase [Thermotogaceae bacterium]
MEKVIGIIGGMGPEATADFFIRFLKKEKVSKDQEHTHIIIDSNSKIPDRTRYLFGDGPNPLPKLLESAKRLENAGATILVMPCNTAHYFYEEIKKHINIPFLNMIEETAIYVKDLKVSDVLIMATNGTVKTGLYQRAFEKYGVSSYVPSPSFQEDVMKGIYLIKAGKNDEGKEKLKKVYENYVDKHGCIILGCTEISIVLNGFPKTVDPVDVVIEKLLKI